MFLLSSAVHLLLWQTLQLALSQQSTVRDAAIDGSACTGEMNQFSVSGHKQQTGSVHLVQPEGPTDDTLCLSRLLLSPPPYAHVHTHSSLRLRLHPWLHLACHRQCPAWLLGGPCCSDGAKQAATPHTHTPLFTPSQDKFNLEVQRTDKTRRQHKGWKGREVIWYLLLPSVTP